MLSWSESSDVEKFLLNSMYVSSIILLLVAIFTQMENFSVTKKA